MDDYIDYTFIPTQAPAPEPPQPRRAAPVDSAETGPVRDDEFERWYRTKGFKLFGTGKQQAQQWYEQRKRASKPAVADAGAVLQDLMDKAMRA